MVFAFLRKKTNINNIIENMPLYLECCKSPHVKMQFCTVLLYILHQPHPSGTPTIQILNLMIYYIY